MALEAAEAVQREHRSGDDGDAERGSHRGSCEAILTGSRISPELSTLDYERFDSRASDSNAVSRTSRCDVRSQRPER